MKEMRKIIYSLLAAFLLMSCEFQESNGPKVSQDTLKDEMFRLIDLTVYKTLSTIEYLVYDYDPSAPSLRDSVINHVAENTWECTLKYRVEGERLYRASENPLVCKKQSGGWWSVTYLGNGVEMGEHENLSFIATIGNRGDSWDVSVVGVIEDGDYKMDFGTDRILVTTNRINPSLHENEIIYSGSYHMETLRKGSYMQSLKVSQNSPLKGEYYEMFDQGRCTWSYCSLVKPDWVE